MVKITIHHISPYITIRVDFGLQLWYLNKKMNSPIRPILSSTPLTVFNRLWLGAAAAAILVLSGLGGGLGASPVHAAPTVAAGTVTISASATTTTIQQSSDRAVLDWSELELAANQSLNFIVPNSSSATLNRIHSAGPSRIAGTITSNGIVYLVNPNGMVFETSSRLAVNGLVATTASLSVFDFMHQPNPTPEHGSGRIELNGTN